MMLIFRIVVALLVLVYLSGQSSKTSPDQTSLFALPPNSFSGQAP